MKAEIAVITLSHIALQLEFDSALSVKNQCTQSPAQRKKNNNNFTWDDWRSLS